MAQIVLRRRWKRAPVGRIVLDEQHPLAVGLALAVDWRRGAADVIRGPAPTVSYAGQVSPTKGSEARNVTAEGHEFGLGPASTEWTLLSFASLGTAKSALLSQSSWPNQSQTYLLANTGAGYGPEAGSFCFGSGVNAGDATLLKATSAIDADPRAYLGLHRADGIEEIWWDGANRGSRSKAVTLNQTDARIRIEGIYTYTGWYSGSNLHILDLVWAVGLRPELAQAVTENPWQIFRRDPVKRYFGASIGTSQDLAASGAATATGTATAAAQIALAGVGVSLASGSATVAASRPIAASGASSASGTATPTIDIVLSALGLTVASGTAALSSNASGSLAATGSATAGGSAAAVANVTISASGLAQAAAQAGLAASVLLAGAGAAAAAGNAALAVQLQALAQGSAQASGTATLQGSTAGQLSASGQATAGGTAVLTLDVRLQAAGGAQAGGSVTLSAGDAATLAASGGASASGAGTIAAQVTLTGAGFVQAMGAGVLSIEIPLQAIGGAIAIGTATLSELPDVLPRVASPYRTWRVRAHNRTLRIRA